MMKKSIVLLIFLLSISSAFARDSIWALCKAESTLFGEANTIVISMYEHRNDRGDGRVTDFTLLYGNWDLKGSFDSTNNDSSKIKLIGKNSNFNGTVMVNNAVNTVELAGTLSLYKNSTKVDAVLKCEDLTH